MILSAIIKLLENRAGLSASSRIYIEGIGREDPQFPFVTVQEISVLPQNSSHDDPGAPQDETVVQINFYAKGLQAFKLAQADARRARLLLHGYRGEAQIETGDLVTIDSCLMTGGTTFINEVDRSIVVQRDFTIVHSI